MRNQGLYFATMFGFGIGGAGVLIELIVNHNLFILLPSLALTAISWFLGPVMNPKAYK